MAGLKITTSIFSWEKILLDRFRNLRRIKGNFSVIVVFNNDYVTLQHISTKAEKIKSKKKLDAI